MLNRLNSWHQPVIQIYRSSVTGKGTLFLYRSDLVRVGRDKVRLCFTGCNLDVYMVLSGKEEALSDRELAEALLFLAGKLKDIR